MQRAFFAIMGLYVSIVVILVVRVLGPIVDSLDQQMNGHAAQIKVPSIVPMSNEIDGAISAHPTLFIHLAAYILAMIAAYVLVLFITHTTTQIIGKIRNRLLHSRQLSAYNMMIQRARRH